MYLGLGLALEVFEGLQLPRQLPHSLLPLPLLLLPPSLLRHQLGLSLGGQRLGTLAGLLQLPVLLLGRLQLGRERERERERENGGVERGGGWKGGNGER